MNARFLFVLILSIGWMAIASAQQARLKRAATYMEELDYMSAIELYNQILSDHDIAEAKINLAEAYRKVNDTENAEFWYGQVVILPESEPVHKLYYGQMLQRNGRCEDAREWFETYVEEVPGDLRGQYLLKACDYEEELRQKNGDIYTIRHLSFNSNLDDFGAALFKDKLVFASERDKGVSTKRIHAWTGNPFLELYSAEIKGEDEIDCCTKASYGDPQKFSNDINTKFHEAIVSFSKDERTVYFTRNNYKDGKLGRSDEGITKLKVFYAQRINEEEWGDAQSLPFNSDEYSVAHPTVTPDDQRLFFASDMPGGFGGMDLYVSENDNGRWGPPVNLGPQINTEGNEIFPFYHEKGILYFSSDGQIGLGGLDIYSVKDMEDGQWGPVNNLGYPLNSIKDDFGIVFNEKGTSGFFSSDRPGGYGYDDIYAFLKESVELEIYVYDEATGEPLEGAEVLHGCTGFSKTTDSVGMVYFDLKIDTCCDFTASLEAFLDNEKEICSRDMEIGDAKRVEIPLRRELDCYVSGTVFDQATGLPIPYALVTVTNNCGHDNPPPVYTDETGYYKMLLQPNCCYRIAGSREQYFATPAEEKCTDCIKEPSAIEHDIYLNPSVAQIPRDGYYRDAETGLWIDPETGEPANVENPDGISYRDGVMYYKGEPYDPDQNIVDTGLQPSPGADDLEPGTPIPYLLHIYYDFDQSYIRDEEKEELQKLCDVMNENPDLIVEISSHTDARGSFNYNMLLSQRRAEAVVRYLTKECGIDRKRLIPHGYGENEPVNDCVNKQPCSEEKHQFNRRTEFRIIGCIGETQIRLSEPKEKVRIDPCEGCPF